MKVKQIPADFVVDERSSLVAADRGRFSVYLLRKQGIGTLEALRAVRRAWRLGQRLVGYGGLKDRHAVTTQWVTLPDGPRKNLDEKAFRLTYEGRSDIPMSRMVLTANAFKIRLRDLGPEQAATLAARLLDATAHGLPAYFDDQRFGSLRGGGGFAALHLLKGDPETALKAVIASPSKEDRTVVRDRKRRIAKCWGAWDEAIPSLTGSPMRAPLVHLRGAPGDFAGAFRALDRDERRLFASAYASSVWNRAVSRRISEATPEADRIVLKGAAGPLVFPRAPEPLQAFEGAILPLPAVKARAEDPAWHAALKAALAEDGLALGQLGALEDFGMDLRATKRAVLFRPLEAKSADPAPDDLNPGRMRLDLSFTLGRGLYATILLKRLAFDLGGAKLFRSA